MAGTKWQKIVGTQSPSFGLSLTGAKLKNNSGVVEVRNNADNAYAEIRTLQLNNTGDVIVLNSDAAGSGADFAYTLQRPNSGMSGAVTLTLPVNDGNNNDVLTTNGSGVLSFAPPDQTSLKCKVVPVAFNSSGTLTGITLETTGIIDHIDVIVDTPFNGTAPTVSVGISGTAEKYMQTADSDLKAAGKTKFTNDPAEPSPGATETVEVYYTASTASQGAARVVIWYVAVVG